MRHSLLQFGLPAHEINRYTDAVRWDHYDLQANTQEEHRLLHDLVEAAAGIEIEWFTLEEGRSYWARALRKYPMPFKARAKPFQ